jgi:hypothetical protein
MIETEESTEMPIFAILMLIVVCVDVFICIETLHVLIDFLQKQKHLKAKHSALVLISVSMVAGCLYQFWPSPISWVSGFFGVFLLLAPPIRIAILFTISKMELASKIAYGILLLLSTVPLLIFLLLSAIASGH